MLDQSVPGWFERTAFGGLGKTGNMCIRASAFRDWPGFDLRLGRGAPLRAGEDTYAFLSLVDRGFRVVYTPDAVVRHSDPETAAELHALHLQVLTQLGLYIGFLFDQTRHRRELVRYGFSPVEGAVGDCINRTSTIRLPASVRCFKCSKVSHYMRNCGLQENSQSDSLERRRM